MPFYEERDEAREHGLDRKRTLIRIILSLFFFAERSEIKRGGHIIPP